MSAPNVDRFPWPSVPMFDVVSFNFRQSYHLLLLPCRSILPMSVSTSLCMCSSSSCDVVTCAVSSMTNVHVSSHQSLTHGQSPTCFRENDHHYDELTSFTVSKPTVILRVLCVRASKMENFVFCVYRSVVCCVLFVVLCCVVLCCVVCLCGVCTVCVCVDVDMCVVLMACARWRGVFR